jgi:hypothetical protein
VAKVFETEVFEKHCRKLSHEQKRQLESLKDRLSSEPDIGKPLGPNMLREMRIQEKRLYFLTGKEAVLLITVSDKDRQQAIIDGIRKRMRVYRQELDFLNGHA